MGHKTNIIQIKIEFFMALNPQETDFPKNIDWWENYYYYYYYYYYYFNFLTAFLTDEIWVILVVKEVNIPGYQSQSVIMHHLTEVGELLLCICDTLHTSNVTQPSQVFTYVRQSRIRLGNNTHYILSRKMSRVVVLYCISPALHNKKNWISEAIRLLLVK